MNHTGSNFEEFRFSPIFTMKIHLGLTFLVRKLRKITLNVFFSRVKFSMDRNSKRAAETI